ncbi:sensor histidine kinase [Reinekea blandensis]|uniref:histidine kinase n=1 Tax=Reinekea blandensis MED297 TaxID=314283 RepID=A4B9N0_9GAMM|nr:ATP-binding protein [Reinekea blandensis]EAR11331.1 Signal transduction histidine kinase regulating C4-dicarboxylate transport system [Reinekea sp. MED297] [Reinekea blandensis MED297]
MATLNLSDSRRSLRRLWRFPIWLLTALLAVVLLLVLTEPMLLHLEMKRSADDASRRMGVYQTSLTTTVERHRYLPDILATDPRIISALTYTGIAESDDISALFERLNVQAQSDEIFLMDTTGLTRWSSNYRSPQSFVGQNYGYRPYFRDALNGRDGFYFAVGATSGIPGLFLSSPVLDRFDTVIGVIVVKISLAPLETRWRDSGDQVWVTDAHGIVFLSSSEQWRYVATRPVSESHRAQLRQTRQYGESEVRTLKSVPDWSDDPWRAIELRESGVHVLYGEQLNDYGWTTNLVVPLDQMRVQVRLQQSVILLLILTLAGGLMYVFERFRRRSAQTALVQMSADRAKHQRAIIDNTDVGLFNLDKNFQPLYYNQKASEMFGLGETRDPFSPQTAIQPWRTDVVEAYRAIGRRQDGVEFPALVSLNAIELDRRREFILTVKDITELTDAQLALELANQELEARVEKRTRDLEAAQAALTQSQRLASLGRMSSAIAHEINQPITALSNYIASSRLLLKRGQTEPVLDNVERIDGLVGRLSRLSRQLRIFAGKRNTGSSPVSLMQPLRYALDLLGSRIEANGVSVRLPENTEVSVQANAMFLEQIVVNLLSNALDALEGTEHPEVQLLLQVPPDAPEGVELCIIDNGPGMSDDQMLQIFEPFYSTKNIGDGMGLGLAISYNLASDMNAKLSVRSTPGQGACFTLTFEQAQWQTETRS